jgi:hypothetical protein
MNDQSEEESKMSRYMMFITHGENLRVEDVPPSIHAAMGEFVSENLKNGKLIETAGLQPTSAGTRVRVARGKLSVTDGPFTEAKEVVGGYALIEAASRTEALDLATQFMELHRVHWPEFEGACEVRPLEVGG